MKKSEQSKQVIRAAEDKKKKERAILDLVYSDKSFESIIPNEEPDFKLKHKFRGAEFGVEVTEFYFSESRARINNIPGYVSGIINEGKYRHKDDITPLGVKEFTIIPGNGRKTQQKIKGIFQKQPDIKKYVTKVAESIENKNKRFNDYIDGLSHVNLIIFDCENRLAGAPSDKFYYYFFKPKLEKMLLDSSFREIFFITKLGPFPSPRHVYIPLKMLFLIAEIYRFNFIMVKNYFKEAKKYSKEEVALFAEYLKWRGAKNIQYKDGHDGYEIVYGNSGVFVTKDNRVNIRNHNDYSLIDGFTQANDTKLSKFFESKFKKLFDESHRTHIFTTELLFDVNKK